MMIIKFVAKSSLKDPYFSFVKLLAETKLITYSNINEELQHI